MRQPKQGREPGEPQRKPKDQLEVTVQQYVLDVGEARFGSTDEAVQAALDNPMRQAHE